MAVEWFGAELIRSTGKALELIDAKFFEEKKALASYVDSKLDRALELIDAKIFEEKKAHASYVDGKIDNALELIDFDDLTGKVKDNFEELGWKLESLERRTGDLIPWVSEAHDGLAGQLDTEVARLREATTQGRDGGGREARRGGGREARRAAAGADEAHRRPRLRPHHVRRGGERQADDNQLGRREAEVGHGPRVRGAREAGRSWT